MRPYECMGCLWFYVKEGKRRNEYFCTYSKHNQNGMKFGRVRRIERLNNCNRYKSKEDKQ